MTNTEALNEAINERQRQETEKKILDLLAEIRDIYHEYYPEGNYLSVVIFDDYIEVNNDYFHNDCHKTINASLSGGIYKSDLIEFDRKNEKEDEDDD